MKPAVFLDRDGTINSDEGHYYIYRPEDFILNPGVTDITFSMEEDDAAKLKAEYGLEVTPEGLVTGTPTKSVKSMNFEVTASSDDSTPTTASMFFRIIEPLQAADGNKFEAEYTDLDGNSGNAPNYFNDRQMIYDKTSYAIDMGLGGMMIWHMACDDTQNLEKSLTGAMKQAIEDRNAL